MSRLLLALATIVIVALAGRAAMAQGVVFANSDPLVTIHSNFTGQTMTLFGNVEAGQGGVPATGAYDIIVLVRGPASDRIVRGRERQFGIMLNASEAVYRRLPGYYAVISSRPLDTILAEDVSADPQLSLAGLVAQTRQGGAVDDGLDAETIRLMSEAGLFIKSERGVSFLSNTTFATRLPLPSSVPNGLFVARAIVVANGEIVSENITSFTVRTEGFERFVARAARNNPLLYGLATVLLALATGWMGGVLFKR